MVGRADAAAKAARATPVARDCGQAAKGSAMKTIPHREDWQVEACDLLLDALDAGADIIPFFRDHNSVPPDGTDDPDECQHWNGMSPRQRARRVLDGLRDCSAPLPDQYAKQLKLADGSTYADAARALASVIS
jgi:hypothetical protein